MWDIKDARRMLRERLSDDFHLNHVGYKVDDDDLSNMVTLVFHLNHVGYKDGTLKESVGTVEAFI